MSFTFTVSVFLLEAGSLDRLSCLCHAGSVAQLSVQLHLSFLIISQDQRDQSYSTVKTTSTAVTVNNLKPGTLYIFQIRTSSSPDYGNYNPGIEVETLAECKCSRGCPWGCCAHSSCPSCSWCPGAAPAPLVLLLQV